MCRCQTATVGEVVWVPTQDASRVGRGEGDVGGHFPYVSTSQVAQNRKKITNTRVFFQNTKKGEMTVSLQNCQFWVWVLGLAPSHGHIKPQSSIWRCLVLQECLFSIINYFLPHYFETLCALCLLSPFRALKNQNHEKITLCITSTWVRCFVLWCLSELLDLKVLARETDPFQVVCFNVIFDVV